MEPEKINPKNLEECKKESKTQDCKAILNQQPKKRCPLGRLQSSQGECRPVQSFCKDSENYDTLL